MNTTDELFHSVLQKLIILFLGLLTVSVMLTSCAPTHKTCAAYSAIDLSPEPVIAHANACEILSED